MAGSGGFTDEVLARTALRAWGCTSPQCSKQDGSDWSCTASLDVQWRGEDVSWQIAGCSLRHSPTPTEETKRTSLFGSLFKTYLSAIGRRESHRLSQSGFSRMRRLLATEIAATPYSVLNYDVDRSRCLTNAHLPGSLFPKSPDASVVLSRSQNCSCRFACHLTVPSVNRYGAAYFCHCQTSAFGVVLPRRGASGTSQMLQRRLQYLQHAIWPRQQGKVDYKIPMLSSKVYHWKQMRFSYTDGSYYPIEFSSYGEESILINIVVYDDVCTEHVQSAKVFIIGFYAVR